MFKYFIDTLIITIKMEFLLWNFNLQGLTWFLSVNFLILWGEATAKNPSLALERRFYACVEANQGLNST